MSKTMIPDGRAWFNMLCRSKVHGDPVLKALPQKKKLKIYLGDLSRSDAKIDQKINWGIGGDLGQKSWAKMKILLVTKLFSFSPLFMARQCRWSPNKGDTTYKRVKWKSCKGWLFNEVQVASSIIQLILSCFSSTLKVVLATGWWYLALKVCLAGPYGRRLWVIPILDLDYKSSLAWEGL